MQYQVIPIGDIWAGGTFCVPTKITTDYIKLASEYELKALMIALSTNGTADSKDVARALGCTESDADDFLSFWVEEGILSKNGEIVAPQKAEEKIEPEAEMPAAKQTETLPPPTLTAKDIVEICRNDEMIANILRYAEEVLGKMLSHVEKQMIVNMMTYYGLPGEVVLVILQYYKTEKSRGKAIGNAYITAMAKNWADEGITTLEAADEKLHDLENTDRLWNEIIAMAGLRHRTPTQKQRDMVKDWHKDFSIEMIGLACDAMKENAEKPTLKYVEGVLKNWKKKGIKTPADVRADQEKHEQSKDKSAPRIDKTYDIDDIEKKAMFNDDYDI